MDGNQFPNGKRLRLDEEAQTMCLVQDFFEEKKEDQLSLENDDFDTSRILPAALEGFVVRRALISVPSRLVTI